jgi:metal-dependent amidase/aminoacylase/carboxypeptidase family protein
MYENPELGFEEFEASKRISSFLDRQGFDVTYPSHGLDHHRHGRSGRLGQAPGMSLPSRSESSATRSRSP